MGVAVTGDNVGTAVAAWLGVAVAGCVAGVVGIAGAVAVRAGTAV